MKKRIATANLTWVMPDDITPDKVALIEKAIDNCAVYGWVISYQKTFKDGHIAFKIELDHEIGGAIIKLELAGLLEKKRAGKIDQILPTLSVGGTDVERNSNVQTS